MSFSNLNIIDPLQRALTKRRNITPTPIQMQGHTTSAEGKRPGGHRPDGLGQDRSIRAATPYSKGCLNSTKPQFLESARPRASADKRTGSAAGSELCHLRSVFFGSDTQLYSVAWVWGNRSRIFPEGSIFWFATPGRAARPDESGLCKAERRRVLRS